MTEEEKHAIENFVLRATPISSLPSGFPSIEELKHCDCCVFIGRNADESYNVGTRHTFDWEEFKHHYPNLPEDVVEAGDLALAVFNLRKKL